jgi:hypothetical protein
MRNQKPDTAPNQVTALGENIESVVNLVESEASKLYESDECERLFAEARERFPVYNDGQMADAPEYIVDSFESAFAEGYTIVQCYSRERISYWLCRPAALELRRSQDGRNAVRLRRAEG